jgi:hypothetical protein
MVLLLAPCPVCAHDGGFGHSRRVIFLAPSADGLILEYRLVQNRDDALVEMVLMDQDHDGKITAEERDRYFQQRAHQLASGLHLQTPGGEEAKLTFVRYELQQALTQTFTFALKTSAREIVLEDRNFPHKPGVVQIRQAEGVTVELARPVDLTHAERFALRIKRTAPLSPPKQPQE